MNIDEVLHGEELYLPNGKEILAEQMKWLDKLYDFNATRPSEMKKREKMLNEMFAEMGEGCYIEPPFYANWGGRHVHFGKQVYANFNLTLVDDTHIYVGDYTMFGPNVTVATAGHPVLPEFRQKGYQYNFPVRIGKNCWIGAGAVIVPGVTIGDNTVIGAGSVVTKDIPSNVVAVGNPCRVLREVGERDREYYFKDRKYPFLRNETGDTKMNLQLVKLEEKYKRHLIEMMDEWSAANEEIIPWVVGRNDYHDFDNYIANLEIKEAHSGLVPDSTFFCLDTDRDIFVGAVNIRHYLNDALLLHGGHIGDGVRPSERRKGIATKMIALALVECRKLGIDRVLMICDKGNIGSAKSIMNNGGILENEIEDEGIIEQRYWIDLK